MNNKSLTPIALFSPSVAILPSASKMAAIDSIPDTCVLVVPSMRRPPTAKEMATFVSRLAPIEMASPSLTHYHHHHPPAPPRSSSGNQQDPAGTTTAIPTTTMTMTSSHQQQQVQGWVIPLAYVACGLILCLCNILIPDGIVACVHVLCPVWTLTLALHALALHSADPTWLWLGGLTGLLLPFILLVRDLLFVCFYLLVFAVFATGGRFWQTLQGPPFVLVCVSWLGLLSGIVLAVLAEHPSAQLSVAAFFALSTAIVSSGARFGKLVLRVGCF